MTSRRKTILIGWSIIGSIFLSVALLWAAATFIDGWLGDVFRSIAGMLSTPFIMETFFSILGLFIVLTLNSYRRQKDAETEYIDSRQIPTEADLKSK